MRSVIKVHSINCIVTVCHYIVKETVSVEESFHWTELKEIMEGSSHFRLDELRNPRNVKWLNKLQFDGDFTIRERFSNYPTYSGDGAEFLRLGSRCVRVRLTVTTVPPSPIRVGTREFERLTRNFVRTLSPYYGE